MMSYRNPDLTDTTSLVEIIMITKPEHRSRKDTVLELRHARTGKHNIIICICNVSEAKMRPSNVHWIYLVHAIGNNILSATLV